jgi:hypothetical protein
VLVVPPSVNVALPSVTVLLDKKLFGKVVATLLIVTFAYVMLFSVVTVFPSWIAVLPSVIVVAKLLSNWDNGILVVALPKVYGTAI